MKKYLTIIKTEWARQITYRLNFIGYRFGNLIEIATQLLLWTALFRTSEYIQGYTYEEMITYILVGWLLTFFTINFGFEMIIAGHIHKGDLSNFLLKPFSYIRYIIILSIGRISMALASSLLLQILLIMLFWKHILAPVDFFSFLFIIPMLCLGYFINLFFSILMGLLSFWTLEVDGIFYSFRIAMRFLSGAYFPIHLLTSSLFRTMFFFPFVYSFYVPIQLYLGKLTFTDAVWGIVIQIIWLVILYGLIKLMWKYGVKKKYEGIGI